MLFDADYHIHSVYSDGELAPEEIVDRYIDNQYKQIAITDHDGIEGSCVAISYSADKDITVFPGVELSSRDRSGNVIHVLGYCFDMEDARLREAMRKLKLWRAERNDLLLAALNGMGYEISIDELLDVNDGRFIGKPTFAKVLASKGYISDISEAFEQIYTRDEIRCIQKKTLSTERAIRLVHNAGGMAVLAHPMEIKKSDEEDKVFVKRLSRILKSMIDMGIDGIECYHPSATSGQATTLRDFAKKRGLIVTGGSDFHSDSARRDYEN